ncbi:MAG: PKD domain-containing protein [bacterium]
MPAVFLAIGAVIVFASCRAAGRLFDASNPSSQPQNLVPPAIENSDPGALLDAISEISEFEVPQDADPQTFDILRAKLIEFVTSASSRKSGLREASSVPKAGFGAVSDLIYDEESGTLSWTYTNWGDYDGSGEVNVADITPIAMYFGSKVEDGAGYPELKRWIDGDGDGEIGVSDIVPIALNYLGEVWGYAVFASETRDGAFSAKLPGSVETTTGAGIPKRCSFEVPAEAGNFFVVRPLDGSGNYGEASNIAPKGIEPRVLSVTPTSGDQGSVVTFEAQVEGSEPLTYFWDFGGAALPNNATDASPEVVLTTYGDFQATLTLSNALGSHAFEFPLSVVPVGTAPEILWVLPETAVEGEFVPFMPFVTGSAPLLAEWDFGEGASPRYSNEAAPLVIWDEPGDYSVHLKVSNYFGSDEVVIVIHIIRQGVSPVVFGASPIKGAEGETVKFIPLIGGSYPMDFNWQFGEAATPSTTTDRFPVVTLGHPGKYRCVLTASNYFGTDETTFELTVTDGDAYGNWPQPGRWATHRSRADVPVAVDSENPRAGRILGLPGKVDSSPIVDEYGAVYVVVADESADPPIDRFCAAKRSGDIEVLFEAVDIIDDPVMDGEGRIFLKAGDGTEYFLYAIGRGYGNLLWSKPIGGAALGLACTKDGKVVAGTSIPNSEPSVKSYWNTGELRWSISAKSEGPGSIAIAPDETAYIFGEDGIKAFGYDSGVSWSKYWSYYGDGGISIGLGGEVLLAAWQEKLVAFDRLGTELWLGGLTACSGPPAVGIDGSVYYGVYPNYLDSISQEGQQLWSTEFTNLGWYDGEANGPLISAPAMDSNGTLYFLFFGQIDDQSQVVSISSTGELLWEYPVGSVQVHHNPAISADGRLFVPAGDLYVFGGEVTGPQAALDVSESTGQVPFTVTLDASGSTDEDGSLLTYEWDVEGDGVWDFNSGYAPKVRHTYTHPGSYSPVVKVSDDGESDYAQASVTASPSMHDKEWHITVLDSGYNGYYRPSMIVSENKPGIAISKYGVLFYLSALDPYGQSWNAPIDPGFSNFGLVFTASEILGKPAMAFSSDLFNDYLAYATAEDQSGFVWSPPVSVDYLMYHDPLGISLQEVNGNPAAAFSRFARGFWFIHANDPDGISWAAPVQLEPGGMNYWEYSVSLVEAGGKPCVFYVHDNQLKATVALDANGDEWNSSVTLDDLELNYSENRVVAAIEVSGCPAVVYFNGSGIYYMRALDPEGTSWGNRVFIDNSNSNFSPSAGIIGGVPAIAYAQHLNVPGMFDGCALAIIRATDADATSWGEPEIIDSLGDVGHFASIAENSVGPCIAYQDRTKQALKFAIYY